MITAVVLSATDYSRTFPGLDVLVHRSTITTPAELQAARFDAVLKVRTPHFFFLDDDDDLPDGHLDVIEQCVAAGAPIAYTDEIVIDPEGSAELRTRAPYSREAHYRDPQLLHHLVLCDTAAAQRSVARLPRGHFAPEVMLYWDLAREGAAYVPGVAYVWRRQPAGMHLWSSTARSQMRAQLWAKDNP